MRTSYVSMWAMLGIMSFGAFGGALIRGDPWGSLRAAFPADTIRQEALRRCGQVDPGFSRFSTQDRTACYRAIGSLPDRVSSSTPGQ